jgi:hypothetical protein
MKLQADNSIGKYHYIREAPWQKTFCFPKPATMWRELSYWLGSCQYLAVKMGANAKSVLT